MERLLARGLLIAIAWDAVELPREVGLAIRGDHPAGELTPRPPASRPRGDWEDVRRGRGRGDGRAPAFRGSPRRWDVRRRAHPGRGARPCVSRGAAKDSGWSPTSSRCWCRPSAASLAGRTAGVDPVVVPTERYDRWRDARWPTGGRCSRPPGRDGSAARACRARGRHQSRRAADVRHGAARSR